MEKAERKTLDWNRLAVKAFFDRLFVFTTYNQHNYFQENLVEKPEAETINLFDNRDVKQILF